MQNIIAESQRLMLWKDELGDVFLLLRCGEVFENDTETLIAHLFLSTGVLWMRKEGVILNELVTDDPLWVVTFSRAFLPALIAKYGFKKRPHIKGTWLRNAEDKLLHKIIPYNPISSQKR